MAHEVLMPKLSSTMDQGTITTWLKEEGDTVAVGDAIFEVMTDKIAIEVEAYDEGILLKKYIEAGESAPVNSVIAYIGKANESVPEKIAAADNDINGLTNEKESTEKPETALVSGEDPAEETHKIRATPAARRIAREQNISLDNIAGTGPRGRIQAKDVVNTANLSLEQNEKSGDSRKSDGFKEENFMPWKGMRKVIADNMVASKQTAPHVTMNASVDCRNLVKLRKEMLPLVEEKVQERLSYLEIIAKAVTIALKTYPIFNAHVTEEGIYQYTNVDLGIAVALEEGLIVPVVQNAQQKGLAELTQEIKMLTRKARNQELSSEYLQSGTFTISSLGKSRVQAFSPIIRLPEAAILGVGGMYSTEKVKVVDEKLQIKEIPMMDLSLSFDHRAADGAPAAEFLSLIVELLEEPIRLLL